MVEVGLQFLISNEGEFKAQLRSMAQTIAAEFSNIGSKNSFESSVKQSNQRIIDHTNETVKTIGNAKKAVAEIPSPGKMSDDWKKLGQSMLFAGTGTYGLYAAANKLKQGIKDVVSEGATFEQKLADLSALTQLTGDDLQYVKEQATEASKAFGIDGVEALNAYMEAVDVMGLKLGRNKELLAEVANQVMLLTKSDAKIDTTTAANSITTMFNQFGGDIDSPKAAEFMKRITNVIAAGSQQGAAQPNDIAASMKKAGPSFMNAKVSPEDAVASLELLSQFGIKGEEAGTTMRNLLMRISSGTKAANAELAKFGLTFYDVNPKVVGFQGSLKKLSDTWLSIKDPVQADNFLRVFFALRPSAGAQALMRDLPTVSQMSRDMTGTNTVQEQADIRMNTVQTDIGRGMSTLKASVRGLFDENKAEIDAIIKGFLNLVSMGIDGTKRTIRSIKTGVTDTINDIKEVFDSIYKMFKWISDHFGKAGGFLSEFGEEFRAFMRMFGGGDAPPAKGRLLNDIRIPNQILSDPFKHAKGGIATKPIFALHEAGEDGPEAIMPLSELAPLMADAMKINNSSGEGMQIFGSFFRTMMSSAVENLFNPWNKHTKESGHAMQDAFRETATKAIQNTAKFAFKHILDLIPGASILTDILGFAGGGDTPTGVPYWVGERGRELRIDKNPGRIIPNYAVNSFLSQSSGGDLSAVISHLKQVVTAVGSQRTIVEDTHQRKIADIVDTKFRGSHRW